MDEKSLTDEPLSDEQVYDLLHEAVLTFMNREARTEHGTDILAVAVKQLQLLQYAMLIISEKQKTDY